MLDRRMFLAGASITTLALSPLKAFVVVAPPAHSSEVALIAHVVRDFLSRIAATGVEHCGSELWRNQYAEWSVVDNIEGKIIDTMHNIYRYRLFIELKLKNNSLMVNNRMPFEAQYLFLEHIPALHDRSGGELFRAFASFAPAHLV